MFPGGVFGIFGDDNGDNELLCFIINGLKEELNFEFESVLVLGFTFVLELKLECEFVLEFVLNNSTSLFGPSTLVNLFSFECNTTIFFNNQISCSKLSSLNFQFSSFSFNAKLIFANFLSFATITLISFDKISSFFLNLSISIWRPFR